MSENKNSKTKIVPCSVQPSCNDIVDLLNLLFFFCCYSLFILSFGWLSLWTLFFYYLNLYEKFKVFSYAHQLLHLLYSYSYFSHMFCDHLYVSTLLVRIYMALVLLPYGAIGANMPYELRYNNTTIIITTITVTGFQ